MNALGQDPDLGKKWSSSNQDCAPEWALPTFTVIGLRDSIRVSGDCSMKRRTLCIVALVMLFAPAPRAQTVAPAAHNAAPASQPSTPASAMDIVGTWQGTLRIPKTDQHPELDLRLVFKISRTDAGALKA